MEYTSLHCGDVERGEHSWAYCGWTLWHGYSTVVPGNVILVATRTATKRPSCAFLLILIVECIEVEDG